MGSDSMLRLGELRFEPQSGHLFVAGEVRRLEPQPAKVLALLAQRAGDVVGYEELRAHVWGRETHVDFERGLRYCIGQIRAALGDSAQNPTFIETLPKRGYRLLVPVSVHDGAEVEPEPAGAIPASKSRPVRAGVSWPVLGVALLIVLVASWLLVRPLSDPPPITIAVVPFDNETGESSNDGLARSFSDAVVAELAGTESRRLAVIGNAAALFGSREGRDIEALGRELGASYVVVGQVLVDTGRIRVLAHLIRVSGQKHLSAYRFEQGDAEAHSFEAEVGRRVAQGVRAELLQPEMVP